jgi:manganese efflux pump family protein
MNGTVTVAIAQRAGHQVLPVITLISWLLTAGVGGYMLGSWIAHDGVRQQRANREGLGPGVIFGHVGLALTGLAVWAAYAITRWPPLAWSAVLVLMPVIGLGVSVVTLWVPYPAPGGAGRAGGGGQLAAPAEDVLASRLTDSTLTHALTDAALASRLVEEVLASATADPARQRRPRGHAAALIPAGHGALALTTFLLAVLSAVGTL